MIGGPRRHRPLAGVLVGLLLFAAAISGGCVASPAPVEVPSKPSTSPSAPGASSPSAAAQGPSAAWTVMVYLDANTDLEAGEMDDLRELAAVGSTRDVNVLVLCARTPEGDEEEGYSNAPVLNLGNWVGCRLLRVEKGRLVPVADWGKASMADGATLARFVKTVTAAWPARRYALILDDHGLGWQGCCGDETAGSGDDVLTLPAFAQALRESLADRPLDLLGFDACLMANFEVARTLAPLARYMAASEDLEPESGWSYRAVLKALTANPSMDGRALGRVIADTYRTSLHDDEDAADATLSVIDLGRIAPLAEAVDALAAACSSSVALGRDGWMRVASARAKSPAYDPGEDGEDEGSDLYDLAAFAKAVGRDVPAAREAAERVQRTLTEAVVHRANGDGQTDANGLSIYLPRRPDALEAADPLTYATAVGAPGAPWHDFLRAYTAATAAQRTPPRIGPLSCTPRTVRDDQEARLTARITPREIAQAWFVLGEPDGDDTMIIGRTSVEPDAAGRLEETWDGFWFQISDGRNSVMSPLSDLEEVEGKEGQYVAQVPAEYRRARQRSWRDVTLRFYLREHADGSATGRLTAAYEDGRYGPREVTIRAGDRVRPLYEEIDAKGEESYIYSDEDEDQLEARKPNGISLVYTRLDPGDWRIGFVVKDHAGNPAQAWTQVRLNP